MIQCENQARMDYGGTIESFANILIVLPLTELN